MNKVKKLIMGLSDSSAPISLKMEDAYVDLKVDSDNYVLSNVSIITQGSAFGHGFEIDDVMLKQVSEGVNSKKKGVPVRFTHPGWNDAIETLMGTCRNARIENGKVRGDIHLAEYASKSPRGDLRGYIMAIAEESPELIGLSISFQPDRFLARNDDKGEPLPPIGRVKKLLAVDFVGEPAANPSGLLSQVNQEPINIGESKMDEIKTELSAGIAPEPVVLRTEQEKTVAAPVVDLAKVERDRVTGIIALSERYKLGKEWSSPLIETGVSLEAARLGALEAYAAKNPPVVPSVIHVGEDRNLSSLKPAIADAVMLKAGAQIEKPHDRAGEFRNRNVVDMGREYLRQLGVKDADSISRPRMAAMLLNPMLLGNAYPQVVSLAQSTGSFTNILADAANKSLLRSYAQYPVKWPSIARRTTNPDFKTITRTALSDAATIVKKTEGQEIKFTTLSDSKESYVLSTYAGGLAFTWESMINDDLDAFNRIPQIQAGAARRREDVVAFNVLIANGTMGDGLALFEEATHKNFTDSGGAPTLTAFATAQLAMRKQKGLGGNNYLDIYPRKIIVPVALEDTVRKLLGTPYDSAATYNNQVPNTFYGAYEIISHPVIDDTTITACWLMADYNQIDTIEMCFLDGEPEPVMESETDFATNDLRFKIRHTMAAKAIDYRGMYRNDGA